LQASWVTAPLCAPLPGYVCLVARRHVIEPYQLPQPEQQAFFAEAMATARAVAELLRPVRVNYELHGNSIPICTCTSTRGMRVTHSSVASSTRATCRSPATMRSSPHCAR
jgi:hypothetical protein